MGASNDRKTEVLIDAKFNFHQENTQDLAWTRFFHWQSWSKYSQRKWIDRDEFDIPLSAWRQELRNDNDSILKRDYVIPRNNLILVNLLPLDVSETIFVLNFTHFHRQSLEIIHYQTTIFLTDILFHRCMQVCWKQVSCVAGIKTRMSSWKRSSQKYLMNQQKSTAKIEMRRSKLNGRFMKLVSLIAWRSKLPVI